MTEARLCLCYGRKARKVEAIDWRRAPDGKYMLCNHCGKSLRAWVIDEVLERKRKAERDGMRLLEMQHEPTAHS